MSSITEINVPNQLNIVTNADNKSQLEFKNSGDLIIKNNVRKAGGRVVVVGTENKLFLNFQNDFTGGLHLDNAYLINLTKAPKDLSVSELVVDQNGKVYLK